MFKSTEKYNIYTSEDKNNTTFIAVINKQNNRLMCASTHTVANGIIIDILSNGPISRYEKYIGKYANYQLMFDEDIEEFVVNAEDSGVKLRITFDHKYASYSKLLDWFHEVKSIETDSLDISSDVNSMNYTIRCVFNPLTLTREGYIIIKYKDHEECDIFTIEFAGSEVHVVMPKDIARHYLPLDKCTIASNYTSNTLTSIDIHPVSPITRISDVNLKDSSTVTAIDNIEGCAESAGVRINFMKS